MPEELAKSAKVYVMQFKDDGLFEGCTNANDINVSYVSNMETEI